MQMCRSIIHCVETNYAVTQNKWRASIVHHCVAITFPLLFKLSLIFLWLLLDLFSPATSLGAASLNNKIIRRGKHSQPECSCCAISIFCSRRYNDTMLPAFEPRVEMRRKRCSGADEEFEIICPEKQRPTRSKAAYFNTSTTTLCVLVLARWAFKLLLKLSPFTPLGWKIVHHPTFCICREGVAF